MTNKDLTEKAKPPSAYNEAALIEQI